MKKQLLIAAAALALAPAAASAGGFYVHEQSASGLGKAYAGMSATGEDGSALWFNPASLAWADNQAYAGVSGVFADSTLSNDGTNLVYPTQAGPFTVPVTGAAGEDPLQATPIPYGGALYGVTDKLKLGVSVNAPFGLEVEYDDDFFGRYDSLKSSVLTLNLQGSAIYQVSPTFAVAGGIDAQYIDAELTNALPNLPASATQLSPDGLLTVEGDDWSLGYNLGAAWRPNERVQLGAHYRSGVEHELEGEATFSGLLGPLSVQNGTVDALAPVDLPGIANVGGAFALTPEWKVLGQVNWFNWSEFTGLEIGLESGQQLETAFNYEDSLSYSAGVEYAPDAYDGMTLRGGLMWDETPTSEGFRSSRVPDSDRFWLTGGASFETEAGWKFDAGAAYVMLDDTSVNRTDSFYGGTQAQTGFNLVSNQEGDAFIASLGASYRF